MNTYEQEAPEGIQHLFGQIAPAYDRNNALLSLGLFRWWNRALAHTMSPSFAGGHLLDLCAGTGEIAKSAFKQKKAPARATLLDFCPQMLDLSRPKLEGRQVDYLVADAQAIPLPNQTVDAVTTAYGIRNIAAPMTCAHEVLRVLKPMGRWGILELTRPANPLLAFGHNLFLKGFVPLLGRLFSSDAEAYRYLSTSVSNFTSPLELAQQLREVGFRSIGIRPLSFGCATLIIAHK